MSAQELNLIGHLFLASAIAVAISQAVLVWALVRRAGRRGPAGPFSPSPDATVEMLENEIERLRGELYRLRNERDWLRKECARLARGEDEEGGR